MAGLRTAGRGRDEIAFHVGDAAHFVRVLLGPVEGQRRAPIVHHEGDVFGGVQFGKKGVEIFGVFGEGVAFGGGALDFA